MGTDHERHLLGRARELADLGELAETATGILGGARRAGLDPAALAGLVGAATALGAGGLEVYAAGRGTGPRHADEKEFLGALADAEDDMNERLGATVLIHDQVVTAMDAALGALDDARAMHTREPCDGCHGRKAAAIADAEARVGMCEAAIEVLEPLTARLRHALARIGAVPADLGETYESVYTLIRRGGTMPHQGRWITGDPDMTTQTIATTGERILAAYASIAGDGRYDGDFITLASLRDALADIPRAELDATLDALYLDQDINLVPRSNQRLLTPADHAAALRTGGENMHLISVPPRD